VQQHLFVLFPVKADSFESGAVRWLRDTRTNSQQTSPRSGSGILTVIWPEQDDEVGDRRRNLVSWDAIDVGLFDERRRLDGDQPPGGIGLDDEEIERDRSCTLGCSPLSVAVTQIQKQ
jgi:hypothetical protein